jgi:hypothetical protein
MLVAVAPILRLRVAAAHLIGERSGGRAVSHVDIVTARAHQLIAADRGTVLVGACPAACRSAAGSGVPQWWAHLPAAVGTAADRAAAGGPGGGAAVLVRG